MNPPALAAGTPSLQSTSSARPSLFAAPVTPAVRQVESLDAQRILYSLLPPPAIERMPHHPGWWIASAVMTLALLGAWYGVLMRARTEPSAESAAVAKTIAADAAPESASAVTSVEPAAQAARIESDSQPTTRPTVNASTVAVRNTHTIEAVPANESAKRSTRAASARAAAPAAKHHSDSDVDLIEALVARVSGRPTQRPSEPQEP